MYDVEALPDNDLHVTNNHALTSGFLWLITILLVCVSFSAAAHEIRPTVVDLEFEDGQVQIDMRANVEALLADIGPEHEDTDSSPNARRYDALRNLPPAALRAELTDAERSFVDAVMLRDDQGRRVVLSLAQLAIPSVGDTRLPRDSQISLTGELPAGARSVSWQWSDDKGPAILRSGMVGTANAYSAYLDAGESSAAIALSGKQPPDSRLRSALDYVQVGLVHIVPRGLDHILFVIGLFLLAPRWRPVVWQVSCFTVAHTCTLALATLGYVSVPASIVEPLIALSIAAIGIENLFVRQVYRWRTLLVFAFGLLHGLGFASVLADVGLQSGQFIGALIAFNVGVEIGQLSVILLCFLLLAWPFRARLWYRQIITIPGSLAISTTGLYWFITRLA